MKLTTAMLLAAGRGQRLSPLTDTLAKPLLPIRGKPLIVHHLERLHTLGIKQVIINVSYLAKQIMQTLGNGNDFGLSIEYSYEKNMLGAAGGVRQALPLIGKDPFLLLSGDIYTDFPFDTFFKDHWSLEGNLLHAVVTDKKINQLGDFSLQQTQLTRPENPEFVYGNIGIFDPEVFSHEPEGHATILPVFLHAIENKRARGEYYSSISNINTIEEYNQEQLC